MTLVGVESGIFIGLDAGTSKLAAVALGLDGAVLACASRRNDAEVDGLPAGRHEQTPARILALTVDLLCEVCEQLGGRVGNVVGVGLTGQMHGVLLADGELDPLTNLITWQDRRAEEPLPGGEGSYLEEFTHRVGESNLAQAHSAPASGYMGVTLFCLKESGSLPDGARWALMCHDWLAAKLAGTEPATDPTDAASSGLYNLKNWRWDEAICGPLGVDPALLPRVCEAGDTLGCVSAAVARATGLPENTTVHVPLGDNQASVLASMRDPMSEVLVNVGTGGQTSAVTETLFSAPDIEPRPFPGRRILSCGMSLCGGSAFRHLAEHYACVLREIGGTEVSESQILAKLVEMAADVPSGAGGLTVEPLFSGKRSDPAARGAMTGVGWDNNSPGFWARAYIEGIVRDLAAHYGTMLGSGLEPRRRLVVSGNAMRRNPIMRQVAESQFGMPVSIPAWEEEAACGAALAAMVGAGALPSFDDAARLVKYGGGTEGQAWTALGQG